MTYSPLANPAATRALLAEFGLSAKKRLGQNFLADDNIVGRILEVAGLNIPEVPETPEAPEAPAVPNTPNTPDTPELGGRVFSAEYAGRRVTNVCTDAGGGRALSAVIEVGPGIGTLTVALLGCADVVAIERDEALVDVLRATVSRYAACAPGRLAVITADALEVGPGEIAAACAGAGFDESRNREFPSQAGESRKREFSPQVGESCEVGAARLPHMVVANLPYSIASTLVLSWLDALPFVESMVVMVQSEVADRMCARPSTKAYGAYTVKLALRAHVTARFQVSPTCFVPAPHVESSVIRLERASALATYEPPATHEPPASGTELVTLASQIADAAFAQRRKTLRNSLRARYGDAATDAMLDAAHIDGSLRAEALSPEAFVELARATCGHAGR